MPLSLFRRQTIWWPTFLGWLLFLLAAGTAGSLWLFKGEAFLSLTERENAEVLVVEGWIGADGIGAAKQEFEKGGYRYVVATSGLTGDSWDSQRWSYAEEAKGQLLRMGIPRERVILAMPAVSEDRRTYQSAVAVRNALLERGIRPAALNVFTKGPHARRSRLVFAKVTGPDMKVGVVAWIPAWYIANPWWRSTERAGDFIKETVGWLFEFFLNSGRTSNSSPRKDPANTALRLRHWVRA